jgi:hypothetical protein
MSEEKESQQKVFEIPPEGSLGLLALGAVGLRAWRKARLESDFEEKLIERSKQMEEEMQKKIEEAKAKQQEKKNNEQKNS